MSLHSQKVDRKGFLTLAAVTVGASAFALKGRNSVREEVSKTQRERLTLARMEPRSVARSVNG